MQVGVVKRNALLGDDQEVCTFADIKRLRIGTPLAQLGAGGPCLRENRKRLSLRLRRRIGAAGGVHHLAGMCGVGGGGLVED